MSEVTVTDSTFDDLVIKASSPVLVDFWAVWCGPCQIQNPILEELAREYEGKATIAKLNVDENPASAGKFAQTILSVPTKPKFARLYIGYRAPPLTTLLFRKIYIIGWNEN